jgi:hypothetical protein
MDDLIRLDNEGKLVRHAKAQAARIVELEAALARERLAGDELLTKYSQVEARADRLDAMLKEAEEVVRFYADEGGNGFATRCGHRGHILNDDGDKARAFLARLEAREVSHD